MGVSRRFVATCNPGFEDIAMMELEEELGARSLELREGKGRVVFEADANGLALERVYALKSIHSIALLLGERTVRTTREGLADIYDAAYASGVHRLIPLGASFAVRATRIGEDHEYTSLDIARVTGDGVARAYEEEYGYAPLVRLNSPSIVIYAEVDDDRYRVGILLAGEQSLHRRGYRVYDHPAALKSTIAYSMLRLVGARDGTTIMDPMCGGGTVAIEAALLFEQAKIICVDVNPRHIKGAILNAVSARVHNRIRFIVHDARRLHEVLDDDSVDYVVSNPPYGIKLGDPWSVRQVISEFLPSLYRVMRPGGRAAIITADSGFFERSARRAGFRIAHARKVRHGDLWTTVFVLVK